MIEDSEESRQAAANFKAATEKMQSYYFTFGGDRIQRYVHIIAVSREEARECMFKHYGKSWAFCYDESSFAGQVAMYGLAELETLVA